MDAEGRVPSESRNAGANRRRATPTGVGLARTDGAATAAGGLGALAAHAEAPVVAKTAVVADLLEALKVLAELGVEIVGHHLRQSAQKT